MADIVARPGSTKACRFSRDNIPDQVDVSMANRFIGFRRLTCQAIALADLVLIADAARDFIRTISRRQWPREKHVFVEKPLAVDAPGVRRVLLAAAEEAKKKNLKIGVGFTAPSSACLPGAVKRLHDGAVGEITSMTCYWLGDSRAGVKRPPEETELQYQLAIGITSPGFPGDFIVDQHIPQHSTSSTGSSSGHPVRRAGHGRAAGAQRQNVARPDSSTTLFVEFEYADGSKLFEPVPQGQLGTHQEVQRTRGGHQGPRRSQRGMRKLFRYHRAERMGMRLSQGRRRTSTPSISR
jgi:predicted dehydrogenase